MNINFIYKNRSHPLWAFFVFLAVVLVGCTPRPAPTALLSPTAYASPLPPTSTATQAATETQSAIPALGAETIPASSTPTVEPSPALSQVGPLEPTSASTGTTAVPTPTPAAEPGLGPDGVGCEEKAAFMADVTIPDGTFFNQQEAFTKTWRFRNEGTCTWTTAYQLVHHSGEIFSAPLSAPFPQAVPPGEYVDLSLEMVAPSRGGPFRSYWWFESPSGTRFGTGSARSDLVWVDISVRFLDVNDQPQGNPAATPPAQPPAGCSPQRSSAVEAEVLALINQIRQQRGLSAFNMSASLSNAAAGHSEDMACNRFVDHAGSNGSTWYDRITAQGYVFTAASENIYVGFPEFGGTASGAVTWWMNSQVHRDNILQPEMVDVGIGYVYSSSSQWGGYYTMVFARP